MKVVFSSSDFDELFVVQGLLENNNIEYFISDECMSNILPHYAIALGGTKISVDDNDFDLAIKIITEEFLKNQQATNSQVYTKSKEKKCPKCGSLNVETVKKPKPVLSLLVSLLFFLPIPLNRKYYQCNECNSFWNIK
ncbi:MAG TPA: DUF2007 domain-containing protein [Spirochaetota bacterium]|nr:DUF2007 domain-containing protein [Spirochaetota bacterium]HOR44853.1 DUF2007 domain-containing protein [Spirochaetota bacterium]HPK55511.1 DUF2007 domain-containing protein [Spirochaetota bacterium]